uniref:Ribosomal protein L13 n=1 Tax=Neogoniolithon spectabile TaxID=231755 RepID=A0A3G3MGQ3_9FLOR|nr:ribosomal protein L13 [Neogoniolithon spectabile]AYR06015.1 ribosomal protein L13 [Neogoniolithon spectabile]
MTNKTYFLNSQQPVWYLIDAKNETLGRISSKIASALNQKNSTLYSPQQKKCTFIIIVNAQYIKVSGNKYKTKMYRRHSGKPGGLKEQNFSEIRKKIPTMIIRKSIKGMLPKNKTNNLLCKNLKIYADKNHPYKSLKLNLINLNKI